MYFALNGISGPNNGKTTFQIQARNPSGFSLQAVLDGIATANNPQGSTISLGWTHNGNTPFILSGTNGAFWSNNPSISWMQGLLPVIGNKPLRHISMPASHDAGMSVITGGTAFGNAADCQTQTKNIGDQLTFGSRFFDLRPVISGGRFVSGHYSDTGVNPISWQGANGQYFDDIIAEVNAFTANHNELVILSVSHMYNTDLGEGNYRDFTQAEADAVLTKLSSLNHLYVAADPNVDLTALSLNDYIGKGQPAVVVVVDSGHDLGSFLGNGFYTLGQFYTTGEYANSNDYGTMVKDQLNKLVTEKPNPDSAVFCLSWTLTQQPVDIADGNTIIDMARTANNGLFADLFSSVTPNSIPNQLYVNMLDNSDFAALAVAINHAFATQIPEKSQRRAMHKKRASSVF